MTRYDHSGLARPDSLSGNISSGAASIQLTSGSTWSALGAVGPFWFVINPGGSTEEKCTATGISAGLLTGVVRGLDGTSPQAHNAGEPVVHCFTALEADQANALVNPTVSVAGSGTYPVVTTETTIAAGGATTISLGAAASIAGRRLTIYNLSSVTPTISTTTTFYFSLARSASSFVLALGESVEMVYDGAEWVILNYTERTADLAWTSYSPTLTNLTIGNGTLTASYKLIGKTLHIRITFVYGSTTSTSGNVAVGLPSGMTAQTGGEQHVIFKIFNGTANYVGIAFASSGTFSPFWPQTGNWPIAQLSANQSSGSNWTIQGTIEIA